MPFLTILLNPICQSRPKLGQNSQIIIICVKVIFFVPMKQILIENNYTGFLLVIGAKTALFWSNAAFLGSGIPDFEAIFDLINAFFTYNPPYTMNGMLEAPQGTFTGEIK